MSLKDYLKATWWIPILATLLGGVYGVNKTKLINLRNFAMSDQDKQRDEVSKSAVERFVSRHGWNKGCGYVWYFTVALAVLAQRT